MSFYFGQWVSNQINFSPTFSLPLHIPSYMSFDFGDNPKTKKYITNMNTLCKHSTYTKFVVWLIKSKKCDECVPEKHTIVINHFSPSLNSHKKSTFKFDWIAITCRFVEIRLNCVLDFNHAFSSKLPRVVNAYEYFRSPLLFKYRNWNVF